MGSISLTLDHLNLRQIDPNVFSLKMWFSLKSAARAASKNRSCVHGAVEPTLLSSRERRRRTILRSFQEIFSSLILKMSGLTLRGRRVCEDLHSVKLRGVKLESLLRFIFTCSGSRSLHLSNHKNCLLFSK